MLIYDLDNLLIGMEVDEDDNGAKLVEDAGVDEAGVEVGDEIAQAKVGEDAEQADIGTQDVGTMVVLPENVGTPAAPPVQEAVSTEVTGTLTAPAT